jgi:hypothetical protein
LTPAAACCGSVVDFSAGPEPFIVVLHALRNTPLCGH